ncbi:MAG: diaminopimelate decarboxylase [Bacillota bacterium]|nr:diaminopimelate decarboxylase [Bacillota bacterium]
MTLPSPKRPPVSLQAAQAIAARWPTPFHLYDEAQIRARVRALQRAFAWNSGFREYFAVKATPNPTLLGILAEEGCGADCSSYAELVLADRVGLKKHDLMFSSNATPIADYRLAIDLGAILNLDDISHIPVLDGLLESWPETVSLRFNPGGVFAVTTDIMDNPGEAKYGLTRPQLTAAVRQLLERGVRRIGLHAFLVSNTLAEAYYPKLAELLFGTAVELRQETGCEIAFVNLSGGIGIPYRETEAAVDIAAVGAGVEKAFAKILIPADMGETSIYLELGRWLLAPTGCLIARVLHLKDTHRQYAGLDACAADLMRPAMYGAYHHITVLGREDAPRDHVYDVTGGLCENNDKFAIGRELPELRPGDFVCIHDTGAHGHAMGYNYNGKLRSAEILLTDDGHARLIRRAERLEDYFATLGISGLLNDLDEYRERTGLRAAAELDSDPLQTTPLELPD